MPVLGYSCRIISLKCFLLWTGPSNWSFLEPFFFFFFFYWQQNIQRQIDFKRWEQSSGNMHKFWKTGTMWLFHGNRKCLPEQHTRSTETAQRYWPRTCPPSPTCGVPATTSSFSYSVFSLDLSSERNKCDARGGESRKSPFSFVS